MATYCLVVVRGSFKDWSVDNYDGDCRSSTQAELAGIMAAVEIAGNTNEETLIYCDSLGAIDEAHKALIIPPQITIKHFKGHQLGSEGVVIDDDVKYHHWADTQARAELCRRIDSQKTRAYNERVKET